MRPPRETEHERRKRRERERAEHVAEHGPACQLCGNVPKRGLDQDHDHRTGVTRGWLCHRCNRALPSWITPEWLILAALYLAWGADEAASMRADITANRADRNGGAS